jgi:uncharacterized membrane protein
MQINIIYKNHEYGNKTYVIYIGIKNSSLKFFISFLRLVSTMYINTTNHTFKQRL